MCTDTCTKVSYGKGAQCMLQKCIHKVNVILNYKEVKIMAFTNSLLIYATIDINYILVHQVGY